MRQHKALLGNFEQVSIFDPGLEAQARNVIAQRLATIRNAHRILVFEHGRIIETGSFDDLVAKGGRFAELARAQFMTGGTEHREVTAAEVVMA